MGWCSGTEWFDDGLSTFLKYVPEDEKFAAVEEWYRCFAYSDWDCQGESSYYADYLQHIMLKVDGVDKYNVVLYINRSDSRCGYCDLPALPDEDGHYTTAGYSPEKEPCGEAWEAVSSDYRNMPELMLTTTFGYDNLKGLPVFTYNGGEYLGGFGGTTSRADAQVSAVRDEEDFTVYEADDLR